MIHLDNNATTQPTPGVIGAVVEVLDESWHNPSSVHRAGQGARRVVDRSRGDIAALIGSRAREIVFTSGATESINMAIRGVLAAQGGTKRTIVTSAIEHEAVRELCGALTREGYTIRHALLLPGGIIDAGAFESGGLLDDDVALVSVQWANNETGVIQEIGRIGEACRSRGVTFHVDGAQWVGRMATDVGTTTIDLLSFTAHKFHGIKGSGGLYVRPGIALRPQQLGVQEMDRRGGTENVAGIAGMGAAAREATAWLADDSGYQNIAAMRDRFERTVVESCAGAVVNTPGDPARRMWGTANIAFPGVQAEALVMMLSERGVCASAGAACSSGSLEPSAVLLAMGVPEQLAQGSVRFSLSRYTTDNDVVSGAGIVVECVKRLTR